MPLIIQPRIKLWTNFRFPLCENANKDHSIPKWQYCQPIISQRIVFKSKPRIKNSYSLTIHSSWRQPVWRSLQSLYLCFFHFHILVSSKSFLTAQIAVPSHYSFLPSPWRIRKKRDLPPKSLRFRNPHSVLPPPFLFWQRRVEGSPKELFGLRTDNFSSESEFEGESVRTWSVRGALFTKQHAK